VWTACFGTHQVQEKYLKHSVIEGYSAVNGSLHTEHFRLLVVWAGVHPICDLLKVYFEATFIIRWGSLWSLIITYMKMTEDMVWVITSSLAIELAHPLQSYLGNV
jgi:hypothetical protein